jgi:hypothetical protein
MTTDFGIQTRKISAQPDAMTLTGSTDPSRTKIQRQQHLFDPYSSISCATERKDFMKMKKPLLIRQIFNGLLIV